MIKALFKFRYTNPNKAVVIDTTSNSGLYRDLSPFLLKAPPAENLENLWQFSKVYHQHWDNVKQCPMPEWYKWRDKGYADKSAHRYPMGKGKIPVCSWWYSRELNYIDARKQIYAPQYALNVIETSGFQHLKEIYDRGENIILLDYDAYDHQSMGMSLKDVINNPNRKMGHAFVLIMILTEELNNCIGGGM